MNDLIQQTNEKCAERLRQFVAKNGNDVAYFIGSGLSIPAYPSWPELAVQMAAYFEARRKGIPGVVPNHSELYRLGPTDLQEIFQRFREADPKLYVNFIRETFERRPTTHRDSVIRILRQRPRLIVTLNFDVAIEAAAQTCSIEITSRFFPKMLYISQERPRVPVLFQLHGRYHEALNEDPDRLVLHTGGYRKYYEDGDQMILGLYAEIFLSRNVVFVGTALEEPEMAVFFRALKRRMQSSEIRRSHLALLPSAAEQIVTDVPTLLETLKQEQSKDATNEADTGIERVRFFKKGQDFLGLDEVLSTAFGENTIIPEPEPLWSHGFQSTH